MKMNFDGPTSKLTTWLLISNCQFHAHSVPRQTMRLTKNSKECVDWEWLLYLNQLHVLITKLRFSFCSITEVKLLKGAFRAKNGPKWAVYSKPSVRRHSSRLQTQWLRRQSWGRSHAMEILQHSSSLHWSPLRAWMSTRHATLSR